MSFLKPLLSLNYWFSLHPEPFIKPVWIALGVLIVIFFFLSAAEKFLSFYYRKYPPFHRIFSRLGRSGLWVSAIAALFYFFNFEGLSMLAARFWWVLIFAGALIWKIIILLDAKKRYPAEKQEFLARQEKQKYL